MLPCYCMCRSCLHTLVIEREERGWRLSINPAEVHLWASVTLAKHVLFVSLPARLPSIHVSVYWCDI